MSSGEDNTYGGNMITSTNKEKGRVGLSLGIAYFGANGYTVSVPLNDTQYYDFIVEKNGIFQTVQCKFTCSEKNVIDLRSTGGTNGAVYDNVLNHALDLLFCADGNLNMYVIPLQELRDKGSINSISLRTSPNPNKQGFETYQYLVKI